MTLVELCNEAARRKLRLERRGDKLAVIPASRCPPEFAAALRQHKPAVMAILENAACGLPSDETPWLCVAGQILAGEFDGCDRSMRESLTIGLRSVVHPICRCALERLGVRIAK